jgi:Phage portal protein
MAWRDLLPWATKAEPARSVRASAPTESATFLSLDDPKLREFLKEGLTSLSGRTVTVETALRNPAMFRAVSLISYAIGMLPFQLYDEETKAKATDHPLYRLLHREPNNWQTAFDFRTLMQLRALVYGDAYALIVRSRQIRTGREEIVRLIPLHSDRMKAVQQDDFSIRYEYQPEKGGLRRYQASEIFHLRGISLDGVHGMSLVKQARDAIGLALSAEIAAGRLYVNGAFIDGYRQDAAARGRHRVPAGRVDGPGRPAFRGPEDAGRGGRPRHRRSAPAAHGR